MDTVLTQPMDTLAAAAPMDSLAAAPMDSVPLRGPTPGQPGRFPVDSAAVTGGLPNTLNAPMDSSAWERLGLPPLNEYLNPSGFQQQELEDLGLYPTGIPRGGRVY
jgi:hypothetical protein